MSWTLVPAPWKHSPDGEKLRNQNKGPAHLAGFKQRMGSRGRVWKAERGRERTERGSGTEERQHLIVKRRPQAEAGPPEKRGTDDSEVGSQKEKTSLNQVRHCMLEKGAYVVGSM